MNITLARIDNLAVVRTLFGATPRYVVSDISAARHLAVSASAYRLLARLDGVRSPAQAADGLGMDGAEVSAFLRRLLAAGLVKPVGATMPTPPPRPQGPVEGRYLFMRRELFELMPILPAIDRGFGWLFRPIGITLWALLGLAALLRLAAGLEGGDLFSWARQFSAGEALALFAVFFVLKLFHKLGHALALRRMAAAEGLPVNSVRAGVALMLLAPFPFTNASASASAAWGLASKWRRAAVSAAGMYVESWVAILAILLWSVSDDPLLRSACLQVATVAGVTTWCSTSTHSAAWMAITSLATSSNAPIWRSAARPPPWRWRRGCLESAPPLPCRRLNRSCWPIGPGCWRIAC